MIRAMQNKKLSPNNSATLRLQRPGNIYEYHGSWYYRVRINGVRHKECLGRCSDFRTFEEVEDLAREVLNGFGPKEDANCRNTTLAEFIESQYLPTQKDILRISTYQEYERVFKQHIQRLPEANLRLKEYRTVHVQRLLDAIAARRSFSITTIKHMKAYLSGIFREASRMGMLGYEISNPNQSPVHSTRLPARSSRSRRETVAYTLDEIRRALDELEDDLETRAVVAVAAFAGLRRAEIQGLRWCDYDGETLTIKQTVWKQFVNPPKSKASASWVPAIPPLREALDAFLAHVKKKDEYNAFDAKDRMFLLTLHHIGRERLEAAFRRAGMKFAGYHAFRRGLASNLFELGADDLTVQRILRHASVQVTREHYIKLRNAKVDAAMDALSRAVASAGPRLEASGPRPGLESKKQDSEVIELTSTEA